MDAVQNRAAPWSWNTASLTVATISTVIGAGSLCMRMAVDSMDSDYNYYTMWSMAGFTVTILIVGARTILPRFQPGHLFSSRSNSPADSPLG